jgi:hypothetical protein
MKALLLLAMLAFAGCDGREDRLRAEESSLMYRQTTAAAFGDTASFRLCQIELDTVRVEERKYANQK